MQLAASFQFKPGTLGLGGNDSASNGNSVNAHYVVTNAVAGIPLLNNQQTVNLLLPGELYGDYVRQVDLRVGQDPALRAHPHAGCDRRLQPVQRESWPDVPAGIRGGSGLDTWYNPQTLLMPRFVRFNITIDF